MARDSAPRRPAHRCVAAFCRRDGRGGVAGEPKLCSEAERGDVSMVEGQGGVSVSRALKWFAIIAGGFVLVMGAAIFGVARWTIASFEAELFAAPDAERCAQPLAQ